MKVMGKIKINLTKAKEISHRYRRMARDLEFAPYDNVIMKQIPGNDNILAEQERAKIRLKYAKIQTDIDECPDVVSLREMIDHLVNPMNPVD